MGGKSTKIILQQQFFLDCTYKEKAISVLF